MQFQNSVTAFVVSPRPSMVHIRRLMREIHQLLRHVSIESILVFLCSSCYWAHFSLFFLSFHKTMDELVVLFIIFLLFLTVEAVDAGRACRSFLKLCYLPS